MLLGRVKRARVNRSTPWLHSSPQSGRGVTQSQLNMRSSSLNTRWTMFIVQIPLYYGKRIWSTRLLHFFFAVSSIGHLRLLRGKILVNVFIDRRGGDLVYVLMCYLLQNYCIVWIVPKRVFLNICEWPRCTSQACFIVEASVAHACYVLFTQALEEKYESTAEILKETKEKLDVAMSNNEHASSLLQVIFYVLYL